MKCVAVEATAMGEQVDTRALAPVFIEPRDDYWVIHSPDGVSVTEQREYRPLAYETASQLENAIYCEQCFPKEGE